VDPTSFATSATDCDPAARFMAQQEDGMTQSVDVETVRRRLADGRYDLSGFRRAAP
jgi:hypothetical protein